MPTQVTLGDGTITGVNTLTVSTSTTLNGVAYAPTVANSDYSTKIATTKFVNTVATKPSIDYITCSGYNGIMILSEGKVYTASGNNSAIAPTYTGIQGLTNSVENFAQIPIPTNSPVVQIGGNQYAGSYALLANGELWVWGENSVGILGLGTPGAGINTATPIPTLTATGVLGVYSSETNGAISVTNTRLFIKKSDNKIYAAGYNANGALADGSTTNRGYWASCLFETGVGTATYTADKTNIISVWNMGATYGCAFAQDSNGRIYAAGYNGYGQLGLGNTTNQPYFRDTGTAWNRGDFSMLIKQVGGGYGYNDNTTTFSKTTVCMLLDNGSSSLVRTCGDNGWGSLGNGTTTDSSTPVAPLGLNDLQVDKICTYGGGPCAIWAMVRNGGLPYTATLWTWGYNGYGQCANGTTSSKLTPSAVQIGGVNVSDVTDIFMHGHDHHTYGYLTAGFCQRAGNGTGLYATDTIGVWGSGYNGYGELGVGDTTNRTTLTKVKLPENAQVKMMGSLSSNDTQKCTVFVMQDNTLYVTGYNKRSNISSDQFSRTTTDSYGVVTTQETISDVSIPIQFQLRRGQ